MDPYVDGVDMVHALKRVYPDGLSEAYVLRSLLLATRQFEAVDLLQHHIKAIEQRQVVDNPQELEQRVIAAAKKLHAARQRFGSVPVVVDKREWAAVRQWLIEKGHYQRITAKAFCQLLQRYVLPPDDCPSESTVQKVHFVGRHPHWRVPGFSVDDEHHINFVASRFAEFF